MQNEDPLPNQPGPGADLHGPSADQSEPDHALYENFDVYQAVAQEMREAGFGIVTYLTVSDVHAEMLRDQPQDSVIERSIARSLKRHLNL